MHALLSPRKDIGLRLDEARMITSSHSVLEVRYFSGFCKSFDLLQLYAFVLQWHPH